MSGVGDVRRIAQNCAELRAAEVPRAHLRLVGVDQVELRGVRRVLEDGGDHLQHRRDTGATRHHPELLARVLLRAALELAVAEVGVRADRPGDVDLVARLEAAEVLRHLAAVGEAVDDAALVHLDHQVDVPHLVVRRRRRVLALDLRPLLLHVLAPVPLARLLRRDDLRQRRVDLEVLADRQPEHRRRLRQHRRLGASRPEGGGGGAAAAAGRGAGGGRGRRGPARHHNHPAAHRRGRRARGPHPDAKPDALPARPAGVCGGSTAPRLAGAASTLHTFTRAPRTHA